MRVFQFFSSKNNSREKDIIPFKPREQHEIYDREVLTTVVMTTKNVFFLSRKSICHRLPWSIWIASPTSWHLVPPPPPAKLTRRYFLQACRQRSNPWPMIRLSTRARRRQPLLQRLDVGPRCHSLTTMRN